MHKVADEEEIETDGDRIIAEVKGREIAVFRLDGEYYAILNFCIHQSGPLCEGEVIKGEFTASNSSIIWEFDTDRCIISCPWHNWQFDIMTGKNVKNSQWEVPTYETRVIEGEIFVTL